MKRRVCVGAMAAWLLLVGCTTKRDLGNIPDGGGAVTGSAGTGGQAGSGGAGSGTAGDGAGGASGSGRGGVSGSGVGGSAGAAGGSGGAAGSGGAGTGGATGAGTGGGVGGSAGMAGGGGGAAGSGGAAAGGGAAGGSGGTAGGSGGAGTGGQSAAGGRGGAGGTAGAIGTGGVSGTGGSGPPPGWMVTGALAPNAGAATVIIDGLGNATLITWRSPGSFSSRGLAHGASAWTPAQVLFSCGSCNSPHADMNAAGVGALAWGQLNSGTGAYTVYARRYVGGQWEAQSQYFSPTATNAVNALVVSPLGTVHLLYGALYTTFATPTGTWATPTRGNLLGLSRDCFAFDPQGNGFLVSEDTASGTSGVQASLFNAATATWAAPQPLSTDLPNWQVVAADNGGGAVAVWPRSNTILAASRYTKAAGWTALPIIVSPVSATIQDLSIVGDGTNFFVSWVQQSGSVYNVYAVRGDGTTWGVVKQVSDGSHSAQWPLQPAMGADAAGNVTATWAQVGSPSMLDVATARYQSATGSWSPPVVLTPAPDAISAAPSLAVSADGVTAVVWTTTSGNVTAAVSQ